MWDETGWPVASCMIWREHSPALRALDSQGAILETLVAAGWIYRSLEPDNGALLQKDNSELRLGLSFAALTDRSGTPPARVIEILEEILSLVRGRFPSLPAAQTEGSIVTLKIPEDLETAIFRNLYPQALAPGFPASWRAAPVSAAYLGLRVDEPGLLVIANVNRSQEGALLEVSWRFQPSDGGTSSLDLQRHRELAGRYLEPLKSFLEEVGSVGDAGP